MFPIQIFPLTPRLTHIFFPIGFELWYLYFKVPQHRQYYLYIYSSKFKLHLRYSQLTQSGIHVPGVVSLCSNQAAQLQLQLLHMLLLSLSSINTRGLLISIMNV